MKKLFVLSLFTVLFCSVSHAQVGGWSGPTGFDGINVLLDRMRIAPNNASSGCGDPYYWVLPYSSVDPEKLKFMQATVLLASITFKRVNLRCEADRVVDVELIHED
jgi:hypothetical protein